MLREKNGGLGSPHSRLNTLSILNVTLGQQAVELCIFVWGEDHEACVVLTYRGFCSFSGCLKSWHRSQKSMKPHGQ